MTTNRVRRPSDLKHCNVHYVGGRIPAPVITTVTTGWPRQPGQMAHLAAADE